MRCVLIKTTEKQPRICIITTRNIFDAPCLEKYRSILSEPFDIIYWDRCGIEETCGAENDFRFEGLLASDAGKMGKLKQYIRYIRFVNNILKTRSYEKLIVFPTQMGWLISRRLCRDYRGRFIFDIRDYAGEQKGFLSRATAKLVKASGLCSITSPAYRHFLPEHEYVVSHNLQPIDEDLILKYRTRVKEPNEPVVLSFIGSVRFIDQQKKLIDVFKNDRRFEIRFIGRGSEQLEDYCKENNVQNASLTGRFERQQLPNFYLETDMAINLYGNGDPYLDYALSNKLYSAAMMGMPILVSPKTYMADIAEKYGFGLAADLDDARCADKVFDYFKNLNHARLFTECDAFMETVSADEKSYQKAVSLFLNGGRAKEE